MNRRRPLCMVKQVGQARRSRSNAVTGQIDVRGFV